MQTKVYFAIRHEGYESETVFGPFVKRRMAADFIEKEEDNNEYRPWWCDDWYIAEIEVAESWKNWKRVTSYSAKRYRPAYCGEQRRIRHEQWRKENPEKAKLEDERDRIFKEALQNPSSPFDLLSNLQFGQEITVKIPKNKGYNEG